MKKFLTYTGILCLTLLLGVSANYGYSLHEARNYTRDIIVPDIEHGQWRHPNGSITKNEISISDLDTSQTEILIKVQDPGFYSHHGIDLSTPGAGLTTITQAITKKLYFKNFKPGISKIKQSLIARFVVDRLITKDDQLTLFLNTMYFGKVDGNPVIGLESAAKAYYDQPVKTLTEQQYISLIALLVAPDTFNPIDHPQWNLDRTHRIKALMAGEYKPKGLMDQYYGALPQEVVKAGLPPVSYFGKISETEKLKDNAHADHTKNRTEDQNL